MSGDRTALRPAGESLQPLRILIADDHAIVREGLKRLLGDTGEGWATVEASTGFQALELMRRQPVDLAVVDLSMPGMSGLDLIRRIKSDFPRIGVLALGMHAEEQYAMRAFKGGATGYLTKEGACTELAAAVRTVAAGGVYVAAGLAGRAVMSPLHGR